MSHFRFSIFRGIFALFPLALASCGFFEPHYPIVKQVNADNALIHFKDPLLADAHQTRVSYLGAFEHVEYTQLETTDLRLEAVYDVAVSVAFVLEYDYTTARMTDTWNANVGQPKSWGSVSTVTAWHGKVDFQPYRLTVTAQNCASFSSEWAYQPRDMFGRPTRVFFGYMCSKADKPLNGSMVASILKSVHFSQGPVEALVPVNGRRSVDQGAFAIAKGKAGSVTGNAEFPFNFGTVYVEGDGGSGPMTH